MRKNLPLFLCLFLISYCHAQETNTGASTSSSSVAESATTPVHSGEIPDLLRETQLGLRAPHYAGIVWYIPFQFWLKSAADQGRSIPDTEKTMAGLKQYTVIFTFAARISGLAAFDYVSPEQLAKKVVIRDAQGNEYQPVPTIADDAKNLAAMLKPVLSNAMGRAGENSVMLFFPANDKQGHAIADPLSSGSFSVVLKDVDGRAEDVYRWQFPLTSISPPKYCPVGKEQVQANWKFCPFHGVALPASPAATDR